MPKITDRLIHAWNAFNGRDPTTLKTGPGSSYNPAKEYFMAITGNDRSIVTAIINRISVDCSSVSILHAKIDKDGNYSEQIDSGLNTALTLSANIDQTGLSFIQDAVTSMCDEGSVAIVPVDIDTPNSSIPDDARAYDILTLRTGKIVEWFPEHVRVRLYNDRTGQKREVILPKKLIAIVENPFYDVMNRPNSTLQRLIRTLRNLDILDSQNSSGKLDLIIQFPYVIKNQLKKEQAEARRQAIEDQLVGSKYGIAYTDGTEKITQLNRPVENNLWNQAKELTDMLFSQLGLTPEVFNGTADEATMLNYYNRTVEPIMAAIAMEMRRKFLTKTARTQGQSIIYYRQPFKLVPVSQIAEIADKLTRNEIMSPNELRAILGYRPSKDPKADELRNRNISQSAEEVKIESEGEFDDSEDS